MGSILCIFDAKDSFWSRFVVVWIAFDRWINRYLDHIALDSWILRWKTMHGKGCVVPSFLVLIHFYQEKTELKSLYLYKESKVSKEKWRLKI